ncbi:hypothetical protein BC832DRAFT_602583 [Gaertneriomyces semiglobifer]|nr:hypothetical protein BC832DRAFT_602583 [Gaertneriomyces semiglobifer]
MFYQQSSPQVAMQLAKPQRPRRFLCEVCPRAYTTRRGLRRHCGSAGHTFEGQPVQSPKRVKDQKARSSPTNPTQNPDTDSPVAKRRKLNDPANQEVPQWPPNARLLKRYPQTYESMPRVPGTYRPVTFLEALNSSSVELAAALYYDLPILRLQDPQVDFAAIYLEAFVKRAIDDRRRALRDEEITRAAWAQCRAGNAGAKRKRPEGDVHVEVEDEHRIPDIAA